MTKYLISFPSEAMDVPDSEMEEVGEAVHALLREAKAAGVWVFGGGIDESIPPVVVTAGGAVTQSTYPQTARIEGGYAVFELPTREAAVEWSARMAAACRCPQELRAFMEDPES